MKDIMNGAAKNLKCDSSDSITALIEAMLNMTRDMTASQAAVAIAGMGSLSFVCCFTIHELSALVKSGRIESVDLANKKIHFNQSNQTINI